VPEAALAYVLYSSVYYNFFSITGLRQTIATGIGLLAIECAERRNLAAYCALLMLASTVHRSVLVCVPLYVLVRIGRPRLAITLMLLAFWPLMFYRQEVADLARTLSGYEPIAFDRVGTLTFTTMLLGVGVGTLWQIGRAAAHDKTISQVANAFVPAIALTPLTWADPNAMRVVQYFSIFIVVLVPRLVTSTREYPRGVETALYITCVIVPPILYALANASTEYRFFWQLMELPEFYR
jgi:hypothetical protein